MRDILVDICFSAAAFAGMSAAFTPRRRCYAMMAPMALRYLPPFSRRLSMFQRQMLMPLFFRCCHIFRCFSPSPHAIQRAYVIIFVTADAYFAATPYGALRQRQRC